MRKILVILSLICAESVSAQQIFPYLASFDKIALYGLADSAGNTKTAGLYNLVFPERDGTRRVQTGRKTSEDYLNGRYGFLHADGSLLCPPIYVEAEDFSNGLALVSTRSGYNIDGGNYGYINRQGQLVIPHRYKYAHSFSEGLAAVSADGKNWEYIDTTGKTVITGPYEKAENFSEGFASVQIPHMLSAEVKSFRKGYIDKKGKMVIQPEYLFLMPFKNGRAIASLPAKPPTQNYYKVVIDKTGKRLTKGDYYEITELGSGQLAVKLKGASSLAKPDDEWGILDAQYNLLPERYNTVPYGNRRLNSFSERGLWGYKDLSNKIIIPAKYSMASAFWEGLALVLDADNKKYGFIDETGKFVIKAQFEKAASFQNGTAIVSKKDDSGKLISGVIDKTGKTVFPFDEYTIFSYDKKRRLLEKNYIQYFEYGNGKTSLASDVETLSNTRWALKTLSQDNNIQGALEILNRLESKNYAYANYWLAYILLQAQPPIKDVARGINLMQKAADAGIPEALYSMGYISQVGLNGSPDYPKAMEWYKKAAAKNNSDALVQMGYLHENGLGVTASPLTAFAQYAKAAQKSNVVAIYNLGQMYFLGKGVTQNKPLGLKWLKQAADWGFQPAKEFLTKSIKM